MPPTRWSMHLLSLHWVLEFEMHTYRGSLVFSLVNKLICAKSGKSSEKSIGGEIIGKLPE